MSGLVDFHDSFHHLYTVNRSLVVIFLLFVSGITSAQTTNIVQLRKEFTAEYDSGHYTQALAKVDQIISYWKAENQKDSTNFYRYRRANTLSVFGNLSEATKESGALVSEIEANPPLPDFMGGLYWTNGKNLVYNSDFAEAIEEFNKCIAFEKSRALPDTTNIANAIEWKGVICFYNDQLPEAQAHVEEALKLRYAVCDSSSMDIGYTLNSLASVYAERLMLTEANTVFEETYRIFKLNLPEDHPQLLSVATNLSTVKSEIGEISAAISLLEEAIAGHEKTGNLYSLLADYYNLGSIYDASLNDSKRGRMYYLKSLILADSILAMPHRRRAQIYDGLGGTYLNEKRYLKADSFFTLAYNERKGMETISTGDLGQSTFNLGGVSILLGDTAKGIKYFKESLSYNASTYGENHPWAAHSMSHLAEIDWQRGNHEKALETYRKCLDIYTKYLTPRHAFPLRTNIKIITCFDEINQPDSADVYLKKAWEGVCDTKGKPIQLKSLSEYPIAFVAPEVLNLIDLNLNVLIKRRELIGNTGNEEGVELMKTMDKLMEKLWPMLSFDNETTSLLPLIKNIYRKGVLLASLNKMDDDQIKMLYLNSLEQSQSASVRSALQNRNAMHYANVPDSIVEMDRRLREKMRFAQANAKPEQDKYLDTLSFKTLNEWRSFQNKLKVQYPEWYKARYAAETPDLSEIQNILAKTGSSLVAYFADDTSLVVLVLNDKNFETNTSTLPLAWRDSVRTFRNLIEARADADRLAPLSYYLYTLFWKPIESKVQQRVMLIPDGALNFLNFETLISSLPKSAEFGDWDWLIKKYTFLYRNSLPGKEKPLKSGKNEVLALAPGFSDDLKSKYHNELGNHQNSDSTFTHWVQTPWSVAFAEELEPKGKSFIGDQATKTAFRENAAHAEILHFGTHAQLNNSKPLSSYLALTPQPQIGDDGYLYAYELYNQPLNARLAVLTACETGMGTYREGDGVISLAHAFQYAGCPNVVYSLWQIDDKQSTWLMKQFYTHIDENQSFSEALHQAKLDYLSQHSGELSAPYYWGGVVLTGSDGQLVASKTFFEKYIWIVALIAALIIGFLLLNWKNRRSKQRSSETL